MKLNFTLPNFNKDKDYLVVAVSCGIDSICLLDLLLKNNYKVIIVHVNHHQRKESEDEEQYIKNYALNNNILIEILEYYPLNKDNFQATARNKRYEFFYEVAKKYNSKYILTAHHLDDQAETIILRLIKGSNMYGYGGISSLTPYKDIMIYRPLLNYSKDDINEYVSNNNLDYFLDSSNLEDDYLRNRIRHNIIPILKKENPSILNSLNNYSKMIKEAFSYIRKQSISYLENNSNIINLDNFKKLDIALQKDILTLYLENNNINISYNLINDLFEITSNFRPQIEQKISNNLVFKKRYNLCFIDKISTKNKEIKTLNLNETIVYNNIKFKLVDTLIDKNVKHIKICYNNIDLPLFFRTRTNGDVIKLKYGTKKLKSFFIDKKIPNEMRDNYIIITDSNNNILSVYNLLNTLLIKEGKNTIYLICEENYE